MTDEAYQPIVLFHDAELGIARAAEFPLTVPYADQFAEDIFFRGQRYSRTGVGDCDGGGFFWNHLVVGDSEIVGFVFYTYDIHPALAHSQLLTASLNVTRDEHEYEMRLFTTPQRPEQDAAQAFGSSLFQSRENCLLLLEDWNREGYAFPLDSGLITLE